MNTIKYGTYSLLEGPYNSFKLSYGVKPSFGVFRCRTADVAGMITDSPNSLFMESSTGVLELRYMYAVKAITVPMMPDISDIVFSDVRIFWDKLYLTQDYNTYAAARTATDDEFTLENLNSGNEYTWADIFDALETLLEITITVNVTPTRKPRNIIANGIPVSVVLQRMLNELNAYLTINCAGLSTTWEADPTLPAFTIEAIGASDAAEYAALSALSSRIISEETIVHNTNVLQPDTITALNSADPSAYSGARIATAGTPDTGSGWGDHKILTPYAAYISGGTVQNSTSLAAINDEITAEYAASFANTWRDIKFADLVPAGINKAIHEITWTSNEQGATTRIRSFRPREEDIPPVPNGLFNYGEYPAGGSGNALRWAKTQETNQADQYISVKLLDPNSPTGTETGAAFDATCIFVDAATAANQCLPVIPQSKAILVSQINGTWYIINPAFIKKTVCS